MADSNTKRSTSRNQPPSSRPTTPLRPSSRTSLRDAQGSRTVSGGSSVLPLETIEPAFAELSDSMADLEANFMHLQLMHESLSRFSESFASFLYGLNMNAFCVDFPEVCLDWVEQVLYAADKFRRRYQTPSREPDNRMSILVSVGMRMLMPNLVLTRWLQVALRDLTAIGQTLMSKLHSCE